MQTTDHLQRKPVVKQGQDNTYTMNDMRPVAEKVWRFNRP